MLTNTQKPVYDGGPAYPCGKSDQTGMSLRDYFAAQAMAAWLTTYGEHQHPVVSGTADVIARTAYEMADAMLKAREQVKS